VGVTGGGARSSRLGLIQIGLLTCARATSSTDRSTACWWLDKRDESWRGRTKGEGSSLTQAAEVPEAIPPYEPPSPPLTPDDRESVEQDLDEQRQALARHDNTEPLPGSFDDWSPTVTGCSPGDRRLERMLAEDNLNIIDHGCLAAVLAGGDTWQQFMADAEQRMGLPWAEIKILVGRAVTRTGRRRRRDMMSRTVGESRLRRPAVSRLRAPLPRPPGLRGRGRPRAARLRARHEYDGYCLHTSSVALPDVLGGSRSRRTTCRVMAWVKPFAAFKRNVRSPTRGSRCSSSPCRKPVVKPGMTYRDWIAEPITLKRGLTGAKPERCAAGCSR
jgi:hypothetical protein